MDNGSALPPDILQMIIQQAEDINTQTYAYLASLTLILYSTALAFGDEVELMWMQKLSIPSTLYFLSRYSAIAYFGIVIGETFIPLDITLRYDLLRRAFYKLNETCQASACNAIAIIGNLSGTFAYLGIQGLLVARAYSLSQSSRGKWYIAALLAFFYLSGFILSLYEEVAFPGCDISDEAFILVKQINLGISCTNIATDTVVFAVTLYQLWGTWALQRDLKQNSDNSIVSILLKQGIWRYCFVATITLINTILSSGTVRSALYFTSTSLQQVLSAIFLCEFSLQLRRRNKSKAEDTPENIQTLSWSFQRAQTVLRRAHDTMTAELGELDTAFSDSDSLTLDALDGPSVDIEMVHTRNSAAAEEARVNVGSSSGLR